EVGLGGEVEPVGDRPDALRTAPDLRRRLLAADVEHPPSLTDAGGRVEEQRRLADAGLAGDEHDRAGDEPAAEHAVELVDPRRAMGRAVPVDLADRHGRPLDTGRGRRPRRRPADLLDRAPGLALAAAADPLDGRPAALG